MYLSPRMAKLDIQNNIFVFLGCVLFFDANARSGDEWSSAFKMMRFEHLINFFYNILSKMELL